MSSDGLRCRQRVFRNTFTHPGPAPGQGQLGNDKKEAEGDSRSAKLISKTRDTPIVSILGVIFALIAMGVHLNALDGPGSLHVCQANL